MKQTRKDVVRRSYPFVGVAFSQVESPPLEEIREALSFGWALVIAERRTVAGLREHGYDVFVEHADGARVPPGLNMRQGDAVEREAARLRAVVL